MTYIEQGFIGNYKGHGKYSGYIETFMELFFRIILHISDKPAWISQVNMVHFFC